MLSPKRCYSVKEVNSDIEDDCEEEEKEKVHDLSCDRLKEADEVVDQVYNPRSGSIVIDEEGEKFLDCISDEEDMKD
jgi:4-aminobutyrate aminotransferase-like enzyme